MQTSSSEPRSNLPIFIGGVVRFANTLTYVDVYKKSLGRGAVAVFSNDPLEPLMPFDVQIQISGEPKEVKARVQVVSRRPGMYLLQLLDDEGTVMETLGELAQKIQDKLAGDLIENVIARAREHAYTSPSGRRPGDPPPKERKKRPAPVNAPGDADKSIPAPISLGVDLPPPPTVDIATDEIPEPPASARVPPLPTGTVAEAVGIDFGQSFCGAAVGVGDLVHMVPDAGGYGSFPTAICYREEGEPALAWEARGLIATDPTRTVSSIKRLLGRPFSDPLIAGYLHSAPFRTKLGTFDRIDVVIDEERRSVQQICGDIITYLRSSVSEQLNREVSQAVLSHPVAFTEDQKKALQETAEQAGFEVIGMLDEPVAVALAYGMGQGKEETIAVYDFGGGTFDFTILRIEQDAHEVLSRAGDAWLGGDDFDLALAQALANLFWRQTKVELQNKAVEWQRLLHACEQAKRLLSDCDEVEVVVRQIITSPEPADLVQRIDRGGFQRISAGLFGQTLGICQDALDDAGLQASQIDRLVLAGGSSRIPYVQDGLASYFGKPADFVIDPEAAVALGAGLKAAQLSGHTAKRVQSD